MLFTTIATCVLSIGLYSLQAQATLKTTFLEEVCWSSHSIDLRNEAAGVLMTVPSSFYAKDNYPFECTVTLVPGQSNSVVLGIFRYDIGPDDLLTIEDSDRHTISLVGQGAFQDERKTVVSDGKMTLRYKRAHRPEGGPTLQPSERGFQFTFTRVTDSKYCDKEDFHCKNNKCIPRKLLCNGHNHCGDNSNQLDCVPKSEADTNKVTISNAPFIATYVIATALVLIIIILAVSLIVVCVQRNKERKARNVDTPRGGNIPLDSVSSNVPVANESQSALSRVRGSLRRFRSPASAPVVNESNQRNESFQATPMYPSLEQMTYASRMQGAQNPEFKMDE